MSIKAMKQALEALEEYQAKGPPFMSCDAAVAALRTAIEQAEQQKPVSALTNLRVPIERINGIQGDLMAYYSSGAQAPKDLLFAASDCIGAILFDLIDAKRGHAALVHAKKQEPVAWMYEWDGRKHLTFTDQRFVEQAHPHFNKSTPLYTAPRQLVGLTDDEAMQTWDGIIKYAPGEVRVKDFARAIEAKLKEKNNVLRSV